MSVQDRSSHGRARSKSSYSFRSDKSQEKESLKETAEEKRRSHLQPMTKANPNAALDEAQPMQQALEDSTLGSLRAITHLDASGNPIAEPDISNPTRPRWERPLDTIRSFEAAIDGGYKQRSPITRAESTPDVYTGFGSRRSSYVGGQDQSPNPRQSQIGGYYGGRQRESFAGDYGPPPTAHPRNRIAQRQQSEPFVPRNGNGQPIYPSPNYHRSRDTVDTGISNGSQSEPWNNSTDPSSENSSIERGIPMKTDTTDYGNAAFGGPPFQGTIMEEYSANDGPGYPRPPNGQPPNAYHQPSQGGAPPQVPMHGRSSSSVIKLGGNSQGSGYPGDNSAGPPSDSFESTKRKSWFKRRFSKD